MAVRLVRRSAAVHPPARPPDVRHEEPGLAVYSLRRAFPDPLPRISGARRNTATERAWRIRRIQATGHASRSVVRSLYRRGSWSGESSSQPSLTAEARFAALIPIHDTPTLFADSAIFSRCHTVARNGHVTPQITLRSGSAFATCNHCSRGTLVHIRRAASVTSAHIQAANPCIARSAFRRRASAR